MNCPTTTQVDIDIFLKSLDIHKDTNIDQRDHTTITGTDDKDYIVGSSGRDDVICYEGGNDVIFGRYMLQSEEYRIFFTN